MKMIRVIIMMLVCCMVLCGCSKVKKEEPICGGTEDNTDKDAPKTITSKDITSLYTHIYSEDDSVPSKRGIFEITIEKGENGKSALTVKGGYEYEMELDDTDLKAVQDIIDKYELVKKNGIDRVTAGLSPEYGPYVLSVKYASGEKLYFRENESPQDAWHTELKAYLEERMIQNGFTELLPPKECSTITRFSIEFNDGHTAYMYGETKVEGEKTVFSREVYDLDEEKEISYTEAEMTDELYEGLQSVIEEYDMRSLHAPDTVNFGQAWDKDGFLTIYVDYETGQIYGEYGPDEIPEGWEKMKTPIQEYMDAYIEAHEIEGP